MTDELTPDEAAVIAVELEPEPEPAPEPEPVPEDEPGEDDDVGAGRVGAKDGELPPDAI